MCAKLCTYWLVYILAFVERYQVLLSNYFWYAFVKNQWREINILQGGVAKHSRYGGVFDDHFIANFWLNERVKEFWKSVNSRNNNKLAACFLDHPVQ